MEKRWNRHDMPASGVVCSLEGISGVGKSYLARELRSALVDLPIVFLSEVVDRTGQDFDREIITLLAQGSDRFFRRGKPLTETFLLLALKMCDFEARIAPALAEGYIVLEDRSLDTIAIYQSLILCPDSLERQVELAQEIYAIGARFRQPPQLTFLVEDDFAAAVARIESRDGRQLTSEEISMLQRASLLYTHHARLHAERILSLSRQSLPLTQLVQMVRTSLEASIVPEERKCERASSLPHSLYMPSIPESPHATNRPCDDLGNLI